MPFYKPFLLLTLSLQALAWLPGHSPVPGWYQALRVCPTPIYPPRFLTRENFQQGWLVVDHFQRHDCTAHGNIYGLGDEFRTPSSVLDSETNYSMASDQQLRQGTAKTFHIDIEKAPEM